MNDFAKYMKNLLTKDNHNIKNVKIGKSALYKGNISKLRKPEEKESNRVQPLAAAILGINNTSAPLPENTNFFRPNSYFDALELFVNTKPTCYLILGKPGAGAYAVGELMAEQYKCIHLSPKNMLNDELEQSSPTGKCINFNMTNSKAITFEVFFEMLHVKLESDVIKHRGYVISGFPLVTCSRSSQYLMNSLSGEEAVMVVGDLLFDTIANLKKKKKKVPVPVGSTATSLGSDAGAPGEGNEEEEEEEQEPEEEVEEEEDIKVELPNYLLDTCTDILQLRKASYNAKKLVLLQQLNYLFNLKLKPDYIIYLTSSDKDMVIKKSHKLIDYKTHHEMFEPFILKTPIEDRWPGKYTTKDHSSHMDEPTLNTKYFVRQPNNFKEKAVEQMCNYRRDILPFLEEKLKEFGPRTVLRIDARLSTNEMMHELSEQLSMLPIKPVIIPQPLYIEEPPEEMEEFWKAVDELNVVHSNTATFNRTVSPWLNRCPVELQKRHTVIGNPKFAVSYMEYVVVPSTLPNLVSFFKNPNPYLKMKYLEPPCRIIVMGTKLSGKTMISECFSWLFDATIIHFQDILKEEEIKKYEVYAKTVLSEIIATIEDTRFAEWQNEEMERYVNLEQWCQSIVTTLKKYIPLLKEYLLKKKKIAEASGDESSTIVAPFMNTFNRIRSSLSTLPFLDDLNECENSLTVDVIVKYAPNALRTPREKPGIPVLGDPDVTEAINAYIEKNELEKEMIPTIEELTNILKNLITSIDVKHQEETKNEEMYGKYIIDGFPSNSEYWDMMAESKFLPDYTVALIENREIEPELIDSYKNINNSIKNYQERFVQADDPLITTRLKMKPPLDNPDLNVKIILHEFIDNTQFEAIPDAETEDVAEAVPETDSWLTFGETIDKFKEGWDSVKLKLEECDKCFIEVQLENKTDIEIIEEVMLKLRKCYYLICEVNEEEEAEEPEVRKSVIKDIFVDNSPQNFGETGIYCPIAFYKYGVLWEGKPEFSVRFDGRLYRLCKEENIELFQNDLTRYQTYDKPYKTLPPLRICVIGCIGSGKTTISKLIAKELGLMHIDLAEIVNIMLMPRHFKKVGRPYENSFTDTPIDDEAVVEFAMDETNENFLSDILSNETEVRKMVFNYFERGSQIIPPLMQKLITKLWFEDPFVKTGIVLDGYPKLPTDIEDMTACYCIPDLIIELESSSENTIDRLSPGMFKKWKTQLAGAKVLAKARFQKEKQEWIDFITKNVIAKVLIDEILDEIFVSSEPIKGLSAESVIIDANPSGSVINTNVFNTYNEMVQEFPEPTDTSEWENAEDVRESIDTRLEGIYETDDENIQALKDVLEEQKIKIETFDGNKSLIKVTRLVLSKLTSLRNRNESFFEDTLIVTSDIGELLLSEGLALISNKFHRMCPVYIYENPNVILNNYNVSKQKNEVYPIIHRSNLYFISGKENVKKFRLNPLKYVVCDNIRDYIQYPLRIGVIGTPKSGISTLSAKLATQYGLICLSRGIAVRHILESLYWTDLGTKMLTALTAGECIDTGKIIKAIQTMTMDHRVITNGFVFDGFPESASEAMELDNIGIYPNIIIDVSADKAYINESSQKEIYYDRLKRQPPYSRPFIENRFEKWNERTFNIRDWIQGDYQNLHTIDGNRSKWECVKQANNIIKEFIPKVNHYLNKVNSEIVPVHFMCISNSEFEKKMTSYKHMCPICLRKKILNHNLFPVIKKGVLQYQQKYYWVCPEHKDMVMKYPDFYLADENVNIPELPLIIKRVNMSLVYEKGMCIVTYAEHLPALIMKPGDSKYAANYKGNSYMFCSKECLDKFLAKPHLYCEITVFRDSNLNKPLCVKSLPNIGYLEQTVGIIITEACISATVHRPKYPGLNFQLSALLHIALYLKTHNPKIEGEPLEAYKKASKIFDGRCKLLTQVSLFLRSMDNPFAAYPNCCGHVKSETLSSSTSSEYSISRSRSIVSSEVFSI